MCKSKYDENAFWSHFIEIKDKTANLRRKKNGRRIVEL